MDFFFFETWDKLLLNSIILSFPLFFFFLGGGGRGLFEKGSLLEASVLLSKQNKQYLGFCFKMSIWFYTEIKSQVLLVKIGVTYLVDAENIAKCHSLPDTYCSFFDGLPWETWTGTFQTMVCLGRYEQAPFRPWCALEDMNRHLSRQILKRLGSVTGKLEHLIIAHRLPPVSSSHGFVHFYVTHFFL